MWCIQPWKEQRRKKTSTSQLDDAGASEARMRIARKQLLRIRLRRLAICVVQTSAGERSCARCVTNTCVRACATMSGAFAYGSGNKVRQVEQPSSPVRTLQNKTHIHRQHRKPQQLINTGHSCLKICNLWGWVLTLSRASNCSRRFPSTSNDWQPSSCEVINPDFKQCFQVQQRLIEEDLTSDKGRRQYRNCLVSALKKTLTTTKPKSNRSRRRQRKLRVFNIKSPPGSKDTWLVLWKELVTNT